MEIDLCSLHIDFKLLPNSPFTGFNSHHTEIGLNFETKVLNSKRMFVKGTMNICFFILHAK